jgi:N-acetylneuraminic acid mutarotase
MKQYLNFLITLLFIIPLKAQDYNIQWSKGTNLPIRLSEIRAIACNDKVYVIGGKITHDNSDLNDNEDVAFIFEYNPENETWTKKANMPTKRYDVALAVVGNKIYAISSKNEAYDTKTNTWQVLNPTPGGMAHLEAAVVDEKIYVFGCEEDSYDKTMMYNPQNDKWTEKAPLPTPRLGPNVAVIDDMICVMGGIGFNEKNQLISKVFAGYRNI